MAGECPRVQDKRVTFTICHVPSYSRGDDRDSDTQGPGEDKAHATIARLRSIRDYAREMVTAGRQPDHPIQPTMPLPEYGETNSVTSNDNDSFSADDGDDEDHSDLSEDAKSNGDSDIDDGVETWEMAVKYSSTKDTTT